MDDKIKTIKAWYLKQRVTAKNGIYSHGQMILLKKRHAERIFLAQERIERYKQAIRL